MITGDPSSYYFPVYVDVPRGSTGYCAYHSAGYCSTPNGVMQFGFFFQVDNDSGCPDPYTYTRKTSLIPTQTSPFSYTPGLNSLASLSAHELSETLTDPAYITSNRWSFGGWYDSNGNENGDKCAWTFPTTQESFSASVGPTVYSPTLAPTSFPVPATTWLLQGEWSNNAYCCSYPSVCKCVSSAGSSSSACCTGYSVYANKGCIASAPPVIIH